MCGIAGFMDLTHRMRAEALRAQVAQMGAALRHRGPDDSGVWCDETQGVALAHRRLAILDLSLAGHQPMLSSCGRYVLVLNGEIYNFRSLRQELERATAIAWRGHSDTEVLLAAIQQWGLAVALQKTVGMFALALWDRAQRTLTLARDRLGEKPLYYGAIHQTVLFASELKAFRAYPHFPAEINRNVMSLYLRHSYIPAPYTIFQGVYKLMPGCLITFHDQAGIAPFPVPDGNLTAPPQGCPVSYWSYADAAQRGLRTPFEGSLDDAAAQLERLLSQALQGQMLADVPVGAFLSGGIDSSTIVALMQVSHRQAVKTFSIGFFDPRLNEAEEARAVAKYLGTEHTDLYVTERDALDVIPHLPNMYDEPFADSSQIPTYLLSKLTREHVTVSLSGDGGDELFGGYDRYRHGARFWRLTRWMPSSARQIVSRLLLAVPEDFFHIRANWVARFFQAPDCLPLKVVKNFQKLAVAFGAAESAACYQCLRSHWQRPGVLLADATAQEPPYLFTSPRADDFTFPPASFLWQMMWFDTLSYLPDDLLVKVDRAAMAVSLETRIPFLDHRLVEFAASLPLAMKYQRGVGKKVLRRVLDRSVPRALMERPKKGFGVPLAAWLRGALRPWAEALLDRERLQREGIFQPEIIRQKWDVHLAGQADWHDELWDILMFQAWLEKY